MLPKLCHTYLAKRLLFISFLVVLGVCLSNLLPGITSTAYAANIYTCTNYEANYRSTPFDADSASMALSLLARATTDLSNAIKSLNSAPAADQQYWINRVASLASSRHDLLLEVVRYNPDMLAPIIASVGLSDGDKALILNNSTNCYEVEKNIEGTVGTSNRTNPDGSSKTEFSVTTADGKIYYLRAAVSLNPELVPGMKIKVKGYILDNEIAFDGSNSANLVIIADKPSSSPRFALASVMASPSLQDCLFTRSGVASSIKSSTLAQWIYEGAQEIGVPPAMLAAFTKVETEQSFSWADDSREISSNTDCHASGAHAIGLLQVIASPWIAGRPTTAQLCNIQFNIRKGAEIFKGNVIQFAGGMADFNNEIAVKRAVCAYGGYPGAPSSCTYGSRFDYAQDVWSGYQKCQNPSAPKGVRTEIASIEAAPGGNVSARGGGRNTYAVRGSLKVVANAASSVGDIQGITFHLENNVPLGSVTKIDNDTYQAEGDSKYLYDGNHTLTAVASSGGQTGTAEINLLVDNTPPSLTITNQPAGSGPFSGELHVTANAADPVSGISKVVFFMDGSEVQTKETAPFAVDIDMSPYINGNHTLSAQAFDGAQNTLTVYKQIQVLNGTDFAPPEQVNIVQPGRNSDGSAILTGWFKVDAYDSGSGIKEVGFYQTKDGGSKEVVGRDISNTDDPQGYYAVAWDPSPGTYQLEAKATDNGGNASLGFLTVRVGPIPQPTSTPQPTPTPASACPGGCASTLPMYCNGGETWQGTGGACQPNGTCGYNYGPVTGDPLHCAPPPTPTPSKNFCPGGCASTLPMYCNGGETWQGTGGACQPNGTCGYNYGPVSGDPLHCAPQPTPTPPKISCPGGCALTLPMYCNGNQTWQGTGGACQPNGTCGYNYGPVSGDPLHCGLFRVCTPGSYNKRCSGNCSDCAANAGEQVVKQCNSAGTGWDPEYGQCSTDCVGPCQVSPSTPSSDTTPPSVAITSPDPGIRIWSNQSITISANVQDTESGVQKVEFYYENALISSCTKTAAPYGCLYTPGSVGFLTTKLIGVKAYDKANNFKLVTIQVPTWY